MSSNTQSALNFFSHALSYAKTIDYNNELEWQKDSVFQNFKEADLLREAAWVILCTGFRERSVRKIFDYITLCFCDWESADEIVAADPNCYLAAMAVFRNKAKLTAITNVAQIVRGTGFSLFKDAVLKDPINELQRLPFIGPITAWHLAKNLGLDIAKPDRHLVRLAAFLGYENPHHLCKEISIATGHQLKVIDLVLWRYLSNNPAAIAGLRDHTPAA